MPVISQLGLMPAIVEQFKDDPAAFQAYLRRHKNALLSALHPEGGTAVSDSGADYYKQLSQVFKYFVEDLTPDQLHEEMMSFLASARRAAQGAGESTSSPILNRLSNENAGLRNQIARLEASLLDMNSKWEEERRAMELAQQETELQATRRLHEAVNRLTAYNPEHTDGVDALCKIIRTSILGSRITKSVHARLLGSVFYRGTRLTYASSAKKAIARVGTDLVYVRRDGLVLTHWLTYEAKKGFTIDPADPFALLRSGCEMLMARAYGNDFSEVEHAEGRRPGETWRRRGFLIGTMDPEIAATVDHNDLFESPQLVVDMLNRDLHRSAPSRHEPTVLLTIDSSADEVRNLGAGKGTRRMFRYRRICVQPNLGVIPETDIELPAPPDSQ